MTTTAALHDLAHVLDAHMEEGQVTPAGRELVSVALGRVFPDRVHTVERCDAQECRDLGCEECPCDADWKAADARLSAWLGNNPRPEAPTPDGVIKERDGRRPDGPGLSHSVSSPSVSPAAAASIPGADRTQEAVAAAARRAADSLGFLKTVADRARDQRAEREDAQRPRPEAASPVGKAEAPASNSQVPPPPEDAVSQPRREGILKAACEPWRFGVGDPPSDDSPLIGPYSAGIGYAIDRLAKLTDAGEYVGADGSETFEGDVDGTIMNVLRAARLYNDETGEFGKASVHDALSADTSCRSD